MRVSNQFGRQGLAASILMALVLTACGASAPSASPPPTPAPTPSPTPDPHLADPATADAIFNSVRLAGLPLSITNAVGGDATSPMVKRINAAIDNWPLVITQFKSSATLRATVKWDPTKQPAAGSPPYVFVGLNIMIAFGPDGGPPPDATRQAQAKRLIEIVDPLLWPLEQRSVTPIASRTAAPSSAVPSASPKAAAKASPKVTPKP
jgi:hypothetical protein